MPLKKLEEFYENYHEVFEGDDVKALDVFTEGGDRIGPVDDVLLDEAGRFRYLIISTGLLGFGKKILLPIGLAHIHYNAKRVIVDGLSKAQVEQLPQYRDGMVIDVEGSEQISILYSDTGKAMASDQERDRLENEPDASTSTLQQDRHSPM